MTQEEVVLKIKAGDPFKDYKEYYDDIVVVKEAIKIDWKNIKYVSDRLKNDVSIALLAVGQSENALKQLPESMQNDLTVLAKAFDVSHKIALIKAEFLSDEKYLKSVLKVGSSEHKIIEMIPSDKLEEYAELIYPFIKKALEKINYAYSDGFTVRSLMYQIPFAKGLEKAKVIVDFDYRMPDDIPLLNSDQLFSLLVITDVSSRFNLQSLLKQIAHTDSILSAEWLLEKNKLTKNEIQVLTDLASHSSSTRVTAFLMMKNRNSSVDPRDELLFLLSSKDAPLLEKGYKQLSDHIFEFDQDEEMILKYLNSRTSILQEDMILNAMSEKLKSKESFIKDITRINNSYFKYASSDLKRNKKFIKKLATETMRYMGSPFLSEIDPSLLDDGDFMDEMMKASPVNLKYASERVRNDKKRILEVVSRSPEIYLTINSTLQNDPEIYTPVLQANGSLFKDLPYDLRLNKDIYKLAIENISGFDILSYAGDEIKSDRELVLESVMKYGRSLKSASSELRSDEVIVYMAMDVVNENGFLRFDCRSEFDNYQEENSGYVNNKNEQEIEKIEYLQTTECSALEYASDQLKSSRDFMLPLIEKNSFLYRFATGAVKNDTEVIEKVLKDEPYCIKYVPSSYIKGLDQKELSYYKQYLDASITSATQTFGFATMKEYEVNVSGDIEKLAKQIAEDPYRFKSLSEDKKKNRELLEAIIKINPRAVHNMWGVPESIYLLAIEKDAGVVEDLYKGMKHNEEFMFKAFKHNAGAIAYALKSMTNKRSFVLEAMSKNGSCLEYVDPKFQKDEDIVFAAIRQEPLSFIFADASLLKQKNIALTIYEILVRNKYFDLIEDRPYDAPYRYDKTGDKPRNYGKKWLQEDIDSLIKDYNSGVKIDLIAKNLGRDVLGCLIKLSENSMINEDQMIKFEHQYRRPREIDYILEAVKDSVKEKAKDSKGVEVKSTSNSNLLKENDQPKEKKSKPKSTATKVEVDTKPSNDVSLEKKVNKVVKESQPKPKKVNPSSKEISVSENGYVLCNPVSEEDITSEQQEMVYMLSEGKDKEAYQLLKKGFKWNYSVDRNVNLLMVAIMYQCKKSATFLINNNIDLTQKTSIEITGADFFRGQMPISISALKLSNKLVEMKEISDLIQKTITNKK